MKEPDKIELRSDEVQEILSRPPHALVRYGISVICGVMLVLITGSFFFRYPDVVRGDVVITTENPPVWLVAKSTGKIKELICSDKQPVCQGDLLAVIDNPASTKDVQAVNRLLSSTRLSDRDFYIPPALLTQSYDLGVIQSDFSAFTKAAMNYDNFLRLNLIKQEKTSLHKQIFDRKYYTTNLRTQFEMKNRELKISESDYERDVLLYKQKAISASEMELADQRYLAKQQELQQLVTAMSLENVESSQLKESVNKLSMQYLQEKNQLFYELKSTCSELQATIANWQQTCLLIAPQSGIVTFNTVWKRNQFINSGDKVFAIVSQKPGRLVGKIKIPASGSGKIETGQTVNVKVSNYPYLEYGLLQGKTTNVSLVANNNFYTVAVSFPKGLRSTVDKELKFSGELNGTAEIITQNLTLIERFFFPIRFVVKKFFGFN